VPAGPGYQAYIGAGAALGLRILAREIGHQRQIVGGTGGRRVQARAVSMAFCMAPFCAMAVRYSA